MEYLGTKNSESSIITKSDLNSAVDNMDSKIEDAKKEANHSWGGRALANGMSPIDAACLSEFGANRLLGFPFENFKFQYFSVTSYSDDNTITETDLHNLLSKTSGKFRLGNTDKPRAFHKMKFIFKVSNGSSEASCLYCITKKLLVRISSGGMTGLRIRVSGSQIDSGAFAELADVPVSGYPGWNSIPLEITLGGYAGQSSGRYGQLAIELYSTSTSSSANENPVKIEGIRLIAPTIFSSTYSLAKNNSPYELNSDGFPVFRKILLTNGNKTASIYLNSDGKLVAEDDSGLHLL